MPNRVGTIDEISGFEDFISFDHAPPAEEIQTLRFPFSYRFPPKWNTGDRGMGKEVDKPFRFEVNVVFLVGTSDNDFGALTRAAEDVIIPFYTLYYANRSILNEVRDIDLSRDGIMGDVILNGQKFFGCQFPVVCVQRRHFVSQL
jgi:hypothetical protein